VCVLGGVGAYICRIRFVQGFNRSSIRTLRPFHRQLLSPMNARYVHEDVYDEFVAKATEAARNWTTGDPMASTTLNGAQVDKLQFDKIMRYIASGKAEGATLKCGGVRSGETGYFIEPTIFADVKDDMKICREEIFGL
jgi:acyl-CoA reductase-like NAD-dependent aldehyde dehydrogenase